MQLIGATRTAQGLQVQAVLDAQTYQTGRKATDEEMAGLELQPQDFHGEWNYSFFPRSPEAP